MNEQLLSAKAVAGLMSLSVRQIWKLHAQERFPRCVRVGRSVRWRATDIGEFIRLGCPNREQFDTAKRFEAAKVEERRAG